MYKCKNLFLLKKYDDLGLFEILQDFDKDIINPIDLQFILDLKNNIKKYL